MGGGGGGYDRPTGGSGSGESGDSDNEESTRVPPPESEEEGDHDQPDQSIESDDDEQDSSSQSGGGGGGGAPIVDPQQDPDDAPEEEDSESEQDDGSSDSDSEEGHQETDDEEQDSERDDENDDDETEEEDECLISESTVLQSPNPEPLEDASEGDIHRVQLQEGAVRVVDSEGRTIGSIAEPWMDTLKECIQAGYQYRARVLEIDGGKCKVRISNKCLVNQSVQLTEIDHSFVPRLHPGDTLSVEMESEEVIVTSGDGSTVGSVPDPWAELLSECIDQDLSYLAEVRSATSESCTVDIQNGSIEE